MLRVPPYLSARHWVPSHLPRETRRRMLFAVRFAALTAVVVLLFTVVNASQSLMVGLANGAFLFGLAAVPLLTRWSRWPSMGGHVLAGTLLAMMAALCLLKGGLLSSPTGWLAAGVFVAVLAVGPRCSVPWVVGLSALLVGLGGHAAERPWPDDLGSVPVYVLSRIAAVWFAWAVASLLEFERAGAYASLMRRREETQLLLDQAAQGFLAIDRHGQVGEQVSEPVHRWLGERPASGALVDWLAHGDPRRAALVRDALENLADGFMPEAVCLQQMSGPLTIGPLRLELTVRPLPAADGYLVVLTDHTEAQARAEAEAVSRQTVQLLDRLHSDRRGTLRVIEEMEQMFADLTARPDGDDAMRLLHTLKGNALVFGLAELSQEAHALEDASAESGELSPVEVRTLHNGWRRIVRGVAPLLVPTGHLDVRVDDVDALEEAVATGQPMTEVAALLERLRQEPADSSLQFLRRAAEELAGELGISESRLMHLFKAGVGVPLRRYLLWERLRLVTTHVAAGDSLSAAALAAGFADSSHLSHRFRSMFGIPASLVLNRHGRLRT